MKKNVGMTDVIIRLVIAALIAILYFTGTVTGTLGIVLLAAGALLLLTSLFSFCPLYALLGIKTRKAN